MAEKPIPLRFVAERGRGKYWVVETEAGYAVGLERRGKMLLDGCERFTDYVAAYDLALDRAEDRRARP